MQAPRFRFNERTTNPNEYIGFIRSLSNKKNNGDAEDILRAVAAQMKNIMKDRFMFVGTLEEAEFNRVFAGRNWNHGQSIELVLRGPTGRFLPMPYVISVMCHEMAHSQQMNHGPKFQKLMAEIKADVKRMQDRGYYGDGFWSDGKRLADSVRMGGDDLNKSDFPEYVCGVTAADARKAKGAGRGPTSSRPPPMVKGEASHRSGRQTEIRKKIGTRVNTDMGSGTRLDGNRVITKEDRDNRKTWIDQLVERLTQHGVPVTNAKKRAAQKFDEENPWWKEGSTRGKRAKSKSAAEQRAEAIERRLAMLSKPEASASASPTTLTGITKLSESTGKDDVNIVKDETEQEASEVDYGEDEGDGVEYDQEGADIEDPHQAAEERKREMEAEMDEAEMEGLRGGWEEWVGEKEKGKSSDGVSAYRESERYCQDEFEGADEAGSSTLAAASRRNVLRLSTKRSLSPVTEGPLKKMDLHTRDSDHQISGKRVGLISKPSFGTRIIEEERDRGLGLKPVGSGSGTTKVLGGSSASQATVRDIGMRGSARENLLQVDRDDKQLIKEKRVMPRDDEGQGWVCKVCTFANIMDHGRCEMCQARPDGTIPEDVSIS